MTSPAYRLAVERLEQLLSPRVVSRTLRMGMQPDGLTPASVDADALEPILKGAVFRQLQVAMAPDQARQAVQELLAELREAEASPEAQGEAPADESAEAGSDGAAPAPQEGAAEGAAEAAPARSQPSGPADPAADPRLRRLQQELRPFNLYFEWPEVRKLRAQIQLLEQEIRAGRDGEEVEAEAERQLEQVRQKLEDTLVLQARELGELEEAFEEVRSLGGAKVRRLEAMLNQVRESQAGRQIAQAELERARKLARDLRKLMASSVYQQGDAPQGPQRAEGAGLQEQLHKLDLEGERDELRHVRRERAALWGYRPDLGDRLEELERQLEQGLGLGEALQTFRDELEREERSQARAISEELDALESRLDGLADEDVQELTRGIEVVRGVLGEGLPDSADMVRLRDLERLARERGRTADADARADASEGRRRLDAQRELLDRLEADLLRHGEEDHEASETLRDALAALRAAQAEERVDDDAADAAREAAARLAEASAGDDAAAGTHRQVRALLDDLDGLATLLDAERAAAMRAELEGIAERAPVPDHELAAAASAVTELRERVLSGARQRLDRLSSEAARWGMNEELTALQEANERLEAGRDPGLAGLQRRVDEARATLKREQVDRLHDLERERERLRDVDATVEARVDEALTLARTQIDEDAPARALQAASAHLEELAGTVERRIADFVPRLDAALEAFERVERLNSEDVAAARRILHHLHGQRDAFERISPGLRAQLEAALQEAEELLATLQEEEAATRAIADRLMSGNHFDDVLGLFGDAGEAAAEGAGGGRGHEATGAAQDAEAWLSRRHGEHGVRAAALLDRARQVTASRGLGDAAEATVAERTETMLRDVEALGKALARGRAHMITLEAERGALLLRRTEHGSALLNSADPSALGLLLRALREDDTLNEVLSRDAREDPDVAGGA